MTPAKDHSMKKTWVITGTSKGFGRVWAQAALRRGDQVVATARQIESLQAFNDRFGERVLTLALDVTDKAAVERVVKQAHDHFGRLDVIVNNAGYGQFGALEELSEQEARAQVETNLFGALWVTQAALPYLRAQGSGHILQVSSIGGVHAFPYLGIYHASKWGLEGLSQALAQEVRPLGIKVTLIEPGGYTMDWAGPSAKFARPLPAYDHVREAMDALQTRCLRLALAHPLRSMLTPGPHTKSAQVVPIP
jgi:NAD(P)-dependent dehydrogenase (short-subunit alcohol dehydrogenase family)